jgi:methylmalonyl-CoA mutase cobalamin-binding domain/chain
MKAGIDILQPELEKQKGQVETQGKVVIGTVAGDIHDIGKSITSSMLYANGFETVDLGVDVSTETFIENVKKHKPDVLGLSALMSTTMKGQQEVIEALKKAGLRDKVKVIIGGAIVNKTWSEEIGADDWSKDALEAVDKVKKLVKG